MKPFIRPNTEIFWKVHAIHNVTKNKNVAVNTDYDTKNKSGCKYKLWMIFPKEITAGKFGILKRRFSQMFK